MLERFSSAGRAAWSLLGLATGLAVLLWIAWQFRIVFPHVVLGGAIVFLLNPIVTALDRRGVPRSAATGLTYVGFVGVFVLIGFLVAPLVSTQADELAEDWPELRADVEEWIDDLSERSKDGNWFVEVPNVEELRDQLGRGTTTAEADEFDRVVANAAAALEASERPVLAADLDRVAADARTNFEEEVGIAEQLATVREVGTRLFEIGLIFLLGPIIAFYLLVDLPHTSERVRLLIPEPVKEEVLFVAHRLGHTIGGYFRGQLLVATIVGIMVSVGLAILGLPFWLLVGMVAGVFNMVPLIGPWVGAVPGVIIALTTSDFSTAIWVMVIMAGAQQIDNHFITPAVMQRTVSLHPSVVMLALLAGGSLGGFFGLLLAVPLTATLKVLVGHLWAHYVLQTPMDVLVAQEAALHASDVDHGLLEPLENYVENELSLDAAEPDAADNGEGSFTAPDTGVSTELPAQAERRP